MRLLHLRLVNFRNHKHTDLPLAPTVNLFVGANAQGKTALLEAVRVLSTGRSFRALRDVEMIGFGEEWARVRAAVGRGQRTEEIDVAFRRDAARESGRATREIRVNGVPVRRGELFGHLLTVMVSAEDLDVITGAPRVRRRVLDTLLSQISPAYYFALQRYARVLLQRNRLLRMRHTASLDAWDDQIAALGTTLTVRRRDIVLRMAAAAQPVYGALIRGRGVFAVEYVPSLGGTTDAEMVAFARDALARTRGEELVRGMTLSGPHRDDLRFHDGGRELQSFGSRGQQLAAVLAIRLAERRLLWEDTGEEPVVLLDDVLLTLDETRQAYLLEAVHGAQVLLTVTTLATLRDIPSGGVAHRVQDGTVTVEPAYLP